MSNKIDKYCERFISDSESEDDFPENLPLDRSKEIIDYLKEINKKMDIILSLHNKTNPSIEIKGSGF